MQTSSYQWVMILGGKAELVMKAKALGLKVLWLQDKNSSQDNQFYLADHVVVTDFNDTNSLLDQAKALHTHIPFQYVVSLSEATLMLAATITKALNLPGTSLDTAYLLKNKLAMRKALMQTGLSPVRAALGETFAELYVFFKNCNGPIIAKPLDSSGSLGIFYITNKEQAIHAWRSLRELKKIPFLMEEYLEGMEVSVEAFSFHGKHQIICITDKIVGPNFVELGHTIPTALPTTQCDEIATFTSSFLDAIGLSDGPSHTEIKLTGQGPRIIESHNRVGGDHINELVQTVYGIDMKKMAIAWPASLITPLQEAIHPQGGAAIRFFSPQPGIVKTIEGFEEAIKAKDVVIYELNLKSGSRVAPVSSSADRPGFIMVRGKTAKHASEHVDQLMQAVHINTNYE